MTKSKFVVRLGILAIAMTMMLSGFLGCSIRKVTAGNVGVKVYLLGKDKGVDHDVLPVGRYFIGINEELYLFPTFKQNYVWTADRREQSENDESMTFQTKEGLSVSADIGITYMVNPEKVGTLFQKYRKGVDEITDVFLRNRVRDALVRHASGMEVESVYGQGKTVLMDNVEKELRDDLSSEGIIIEKIYWIGDIRLPPTVKASLDAKIQATQRAMQRENEVKEAEAQAKKLIAEAKGEAESLRRKSMAITNQMIEYEKVKNQGRAIEKWDGNLPTTLLGGGNGGGIPFIKIDGNK